MNDLRKFISDIMEHAHYQAFLDEVGNHRPVLPTYDLNNVEEWKLKSGRQQGYDSFAALLNIKFGE